MGQFILSDGLYVYPTPAGTYYAFSSAARQPAQELLRALLAEPVTPMLTLDGLQRWSTLEDPDQAMSLLHHAQQARWVQGFEAPLRCPSQAVEESVPPLLAALSSQGRGLLADSQGFHLASAGFPHEVAEELSGLSAELASMNERRSGLLLNNMGLASSAWSVADAAGTSRLGFWPIYVGGLRFVLVIQGAPRLNQPEYVRLVWILNQRFNSALPVSQSHH
ncbi:hypothetical protein [Methyloterricola oryzae]|uniref:hypothetical protein n=1 Tax=Methyloterricola oryzae TaxID=1495050 RepID=UPI0005EBE32F|nr:hypothetical protein [Methyloterricola oryzae]